MNKKLLRLLSLILAVTMVISMMPMTVLAAEWDGTPSADAPIGSGTADEPYQITNAADLKWFADKVNGSTAKSTSTLCAVLADNIDLAQNEWTPIGCYNSYSDCVYYGGVFDGNGKTISGLAINTNKQYRALFGYVKGAEIKNLTVDGYVETTATSSAYAAGIVAYGNPVVMENCTNNADVTSASKGYIAGVVSGATGGSTLTNCNNNGDISGCGDYIGGIVGSATGSSSAGITTIKNCFNSASITNGGTPSSYSYSTGGIAGGISGGSVISMCGNTGDIVSTLKRTGGIAGTIGGSIERCFNTGNITGIYGVGGIAGDSADKTSSIASCYNTATVTANTPSISFNDANAKGVGGIIGGVSSNSYNAVLKDCYSVGKVILDTSLADVLAGGIVGDSSGKNYSGVETSNLVTADNCFYLDTAASQGNGRNAAAQGIISKTSDEMKDSSFAPALGKDYISDSNGGYPLLGWQNPDAEYDVNFVLSPSGAVLTVKDSSGAVIPSETTSYHLKNGVYSYTVTGEECEDVNGSFTVSYSGQNITVALKVKTYDFVFTTEPEDAVLTVDGQTPLADGRTYQLSKIDNPYAYKVDAFGYEQAVGTVTVTGDADKDKLAVSLKKMALHTVTLPFVKEDGGAESDVNILVKSDEYPNAAIAQQDDGSFSLPDGKYSYTITSAGYKSVKGSFSVDGEDITLEQVLLEIQTAWDGETITEPAQDSEGVYLISSPDELIWYQKNAQLNSSARLMSDICINEDVDAENISGLYSWSPIGTNSSKAYTGDFDGNGHTISGLYVPVSGSNAGVFGYVGTGGSIHDLTISDTFVVSNNGSYVGAVVGDLKGTINNCHVTDTVTVNGKSYVGGVVGELDTGGMVSGCSNAGTVIAGGDTAGGIAGRIYSAASNALVDSENTGSVAAARYAGGITGMLYNNGTVENVFSAGECKAVNSCAGGLIGYFRCGTIRNAYAAGTISANSSGGAFGFLDWATGQKTVDNVYYLDAIADEAVGNVNGCTIQGTVQACTSDELKILADALGDAFFENEAEQNNGYPLLYWQAGEQITNPDAPTPDPDGWNGKTSSKAPLQKEGVYQIGTPAELKWFGRAAKETTDIRGVLTADIDLNYQQWTPIGGSAVDTAFCGILDGNGFSIKNLYISSGSAAGLFAYNAGEIKNLTIEGIIQSADNAGGVAAYNNGKISNVNTYVKINGGNHIAGIVGNNEAYGSVIQCRNFGNITGGQYVAGITALNKGTVSESGNSGAVISSNSFAAGVAADNNNGIVKSCANNGMIVGKAAVQYAYTGGVIGRNNGSAQNLYNSGNVVSLGSSAGGCVAINTTGSSASGLYNAGDVCGSYIDTEDGEDFRVGGAVGEIVSGVSGAYTLNTLTISTGGTLVSEAELNRLAGSLTEMIPIKSDITGVCFIGAPMAEDTVKAEYNGNADNPIFVWYLFDGYDETVLAVTDEYKIPADLVGYRLYAKVMDASLQGVITCASEAIDGFKGSVKINGYAVIGHTLNAVYAGSEENLSYQWYRASAKIDGATASSYTVAAEDEGRTLTVRVYGSKPGYIEKQTDKVKTADQAGIWPTAEVLEPQTDINGIYLITNEAELKWLASTVNGGNTTVNAKLSDNIKLTSDKWYPIGSSQHPYAGTFDGNNKAITDVNLHSTYNEQGFFGNIGGKGEVKNLALSGTVNVTGDDAISTGGIAGYLDGRITGCSFDGTVSGVQDVGGIVGQAGLNSNVSQCINNASVSGKENIGGIAGSCSYGNIIECVNNGNVGNDDSTHAGGIAGSISNYAVVTACYNTGHVIGYDYLGGIAGSASVCAAPQGCYNVGKVDAGAHAFGVLGDLSGTDYISVVKGSYYLTQSAQTATDKTAQGVSSDGMKKSAFVSLLNAQAGSSLFVMDLKEENSGYPILIWQTGSAADDGNDKDPEQPDILTVSFTLCVNASDDKNEDVNWIVAEDCTIPNGATAYELFKKILNDYGYTYEANGNSYVSSVTTPDGVTLSELDQGPRSGWMYTINGEFPNYMASVKLKDKDEMRFFYTSDYRNTGWNPTDPVVIQVERLIDAIGTVTLDSVDAIQTARDAYDMLTDEQKFGVSNKDVLVDAEAAYNKLLAEKPEQDKAAAQAVEKLIDEIGTVSLTSKDAILSARNAYNALTNDQKNLVSNLSVLENAEETFNQLVGEKTAADIEAANNVDLLINAIGTVTVRSGAAIETARNAFDLLTNEQKNYVTKESVLNKAETSLKKLIAEQDVMRKDIYTATGDTLLSGNVPMVSVIGGEWVVLGLARSGRISDAFIAGYYNNLVDTLNSNGSEKLHKSRSTENSRAVIALSSLGFDATDVEGYNLLLPLADMDYLQKQGINGSIWALIAFDTREYEIPTVSGVKNQTTREKLIDAILAEQTSSGSWLLEDEIGDISLTAMAIQALAPYAETNPAVKSAIEKALTFLSKQQRADGSFISYGEASSESCAQVIVALTSLGINPDNDERFIKNGKSVLDALLAFYEDGAFKHTMDGSVDNMATEQAYYALASYYRLLDNKTSLYDMRDVEINTDIPEIVNKGNKNDKEVISENSEKKDTDNQNSYVNKNTSDKSPLTGNDTVLYISVCILILCSAVFTVQYKRRQENIQ
ncbi:MAG: DUF4430 domain-containing protein [Clostridium sp.]|nr:DUF4430 domain-containing protein [Clostridium sp.]